MFCSSSRAGMMREIFWAEASWFGRVRGRLRERRIAREMRRAMRGKSIWGLG